MLMEVTHAEETCTRNLYLKLARKYRAAFYSVHVSFSCTSFLSVCHPYYSGAMQFGRQLPQGVSPAARHHIIVPKRKGGDIYY